MLSGGGEALAYLGGLSFTEPAFVFVVLSLCATRPILRFAGSALDRLSGWLPFAPGISFYLVALGAGPLLGSFITEPAAMTVIALLLLERLYSRPISSRLKYATLGLLFVNVSVGGTLTPYAAPPVLMVAPGWGWDLPFMIQSFGWRAAASCLLATAGTAFFFRRELSALGPSGSARQSRIPPWLTLLHLAALAAVVLASHHVVVFIGVFIFFLGLLQVTAEYQSAPKLREAFLVAFFLGGLVILGAPQRWWLEPLITRLEPSALFFGATALTAVTDNAALTYLGAQVPDLAHALRVALVSGAVVGGGLTVVANAPNPAGYGILDGAFGADGIRPLGLLAGAAPPTAVAIVCFWFI